jgi:hypothetical protein
MVNLIPSSALPVLNKTLDAIRLRANANGEIFGGEMMDAMQETGTALGVNRLEVLVIRRVLVRAMESSGESYPTDVLQNFETRMRVSDALKYLRAAIELASQPQASSKEASV